MLKMNIWYGRKDINTDLENDNGFEGPVIHNIEKVVVTYVHMMRLFFATREDLEKAVELTGWGEMDELVLEVPYEEDMVKTKDGWFGDFSFSAEGEG